MAAGAKWYIVQAYSGYEKKVAEAIKAAAELHGLEALIEEVLVPVEEVVKVKKGKKDIIQEIFKRFYQPFFIPILCLVACMQIINNRFNNYYTIYKIIIFIFVLF